jgi:hypothetical protein
MTVRQTSKRELSSALQARYCKASSFGARALLGVTAVSFDLLFAGHRVARSLEVSW